MEVKLKYTKSQSDSIEKITIDLNSHIQKVINSAIVEKVLANIHNPWEHGTPILNGNTGRPSVRGTAAEPEQ